MNPATIRLSLASLLLVSTMLIHTGHGATASAESNSIVVETRAFGVSVETSTVVVDTRMKFEFWATEAGLVQPNNGISDTPFHDGTPNLAKFAFNMDSSRVDTHSLTPGGTSGWPVSEIINEGDESVLCLVSLRRKDTEGLAYTACFSRDMTNWIEVTVPMQITTIDSIWERVRYRVPTTESPSKRWFGRVEVTYTP